MNFLVSFIYFFTFSFEYLLTELSTTLCAFFSKINFLEEFVRVSNNIEKTSAYKTKKKLKILNVYDRLELVL